MEPRKALLKRLASVTNWGDSKRTKFEGEAWLETRNTIYRFRDGVCFQVARRDGRQARSTELVGMRLVAWLTGTQEHTRVALEWVPGAYAVLWRPETDEGGEVMAMTSPTTVFARGHSSAHLQAIHDHAPPCDSQLVRRQAPRPAAGRSPLPSHATRPT
jgi:hypothetical protein